MSEENNRTDELEVDDSDFDSVFDSLVEGDDAPEEDGDATDNSDTSNASDSESEVDPQIDESEQEDRNEENETSEAEEGDWKTLYEREVQRTRSWDGRLRVADSKIKELEDELRKAKESQAKSPSSRDVEDDDAILNTFLEEFPDLEKPLTVLVAKKAKEQAEALITSKLSEFTPIKQTYEKQMAANHMQAIASSHPDWQELVKSGSVQQWIESQPEYMKVPLNRVYQQGSTEEVIDLLNRFKAMNGVPNTTPTGQKNKKDKISSAVAVQAGRSLPPKREPDPNDYDGTWERITRS